MALRLHVMAVAAEHLVMGSLMRRNILTYKAPEGNEGYDLIGIHPDPRHNASNDHSSQVRVQVKSRYQTDSDRGFPIKENKLDAFDFLVVVFLNIGEFASGKDGSTGAAPTEYYTLTPEFVRKHHDTSSSWQKVKLRGLDSEISGVRDELGFELIANALGVPPVTR
jgi:hypothetical protein